MTQNLCVGQERTLRNSRVNNAWCILLFPHTSGVQWAVVFLFTCKNEGSSRHTESTVTYKTIEIILKNENMGIRLSRGSIAGIPMFAVAGRNGPRKLCHTANTMLQNPKTSDSAQHKPCRLNSAIK